MIRDELVTIVVAEGQTLLREGIAAICEATPRFRVIGHCGEGEAAVKMISSLQPDIAILDLDLPRLHGAAVIRRIRAKELRAKIVVM